MGLQVKTLRAKILLPTVTLTFVLLLGLGCFMTWQTHRALQTDLESKINSMVSLLQKISAPYISNFDYPALELFVEEIIKDSDVEWAVFYDEKGSILTTKCQERPATPSSVLVERTIVDNDGKTVIGRIKFSYNTRGLTVHARDDLRITGLALLLGFVVAVISVRVIARSITTPLLQTRDMLFDMTAGRLQRRLHLQRQDELGQMAGAMNEFADKLQHQMVTTLDQIAEGDLTVTTHPKDSEDTVGNALQKTVDALCSMVGEISKASDEIAAGSSQLSDASDMLSKGTIEAAEAMDQITSSMATLSSQTTTNAENANQANTLAKQARDDAKIGNHLMENLVDAMGEINASGQNIAKIIKTIDEIAFQTNLLALNAAVEAARAGRHGKGFAVVAEEVRNLAVRSAKASRETAELIEGAMEKARNGSEIADRTAKALSEIVSGANKVTDLVGEIATASNEQANGIAQIKQGLGQIDQVTQQNTASAEQSSSIAGELSTQALQLKQMLARFKVR